MYLRRNSINKYNYNIIVIGAGSAGLVSSYIATLLKAKVLLIEKNQMGGDCLNTGCVPSKTLIKSAKVLSYFKRSKEFGFKRITADFEFKDLMKKVNDTIKKIAPHDSIERYSSLGVDCLKGNGKIVGKHSVEINGEIKTARSIIIATGASPFLPKIKGLKKIKYYTSENIWTLKKLPKNFRSDLKKLRRLT